MKRRNFLKLLGAGVIAAAAAPTYGTLIEPVLFDIVEQRLPLRLIGPGMHGLRVVQLSDIHIGPWFTEERLEKVVSLVIEQQPDLVFITGDFLSRDGDYPSMKKSLFDPLRELSRHSAVYSVLGNHDLHDGLGSDMRKMLGEAGLQDVTNTYQSYQRGGETLYIAGVGTLSTGHMRLSQLKNEIPTDAPAFMLAHEPDIAKYTREIPSFVMQFSGHSHGGQVILPFSGPIMLPWMGRLYPVGLYDLDTMFVYTNRGLGMTGVPVRFNCPPEITVFTFAQANIG